MTKTTIKFAGNVYSEDLVPASGGVQPKPLSGMNGGQLLELYNLVSSNLGRGRVKRFADTKTAIRRTWAILVEYAAQPDDDFQMSEEELAKQTGRPKAEPLQRADGSPVVDTKGPVSLTDADKKQVSDEAASRKAPPKSEQLLQAAAAAGAKTQAQAALRNNPPASKNPAKDAEMPALRKAIKALDLAPKAKVYARKAGSKQALLVDMLARPEGATFGELYDALAASGKPWKGVTIRSGLAWDINHIAGYGVKSDLFNGEEFAEQGRSYEAQRLGLIPHGPISESSYRQADGYDPELRLAVYRLVYPAGMTEPLAHIGGKKD